MKNFFNYNKPPKVSEFAKKRISQNLQAKFSEAPVKFEGVKYNGAIIKPLKICVNCSNFTRQPNTNLCYRCLKLNKPPVTFGELFQVVKYDFTRIVKRYFKKSRKYLRREYWFTASRIGGKRVTNLPLKWWASFCGFGDDSPKPRATNIFMVVNKEKLGNVIAFVVVVASASGLFYIFWLLSTE